MTRLEVALASHVGLVRRRNEDAIGVNGWLLTSTDADPFAFRFSPVEPGAEAVVVLADGMGGHAAGDVAAALTARLVSRTGLGHDVASITGRVREADAAVAAASREEGRGGMGSTLVGLRAGAGGAVLFNVGDSRGYRLDGGYLGRLTRDDRRAGAGGGALSAAVGLGEGRLTPHVTEIPVNVDARLLLCSDGLWDVVDEDDIEAILTGGTPGAAAGRLLAAALARGAPDNVSLVVIDIGPGD